MANTVAHLTVAHRIYTEHPEIINCCKAYYLGSIAPDTISSKPGCERNDKKFVHLRADIRDVDWLSEEKMQIFDNRIQSFTNEFINGMSNSGHRDFCIGYLVHLLTDKWNHKTIRQKMLRIANSHGVQESDKNFYHMMVNDLEALDDYLLKNHAEIYSLFMELTNGPVEYSLPGYIEKEYIEGSIKWWKNCYLPKIKERQLMYISEIDIGEFIELAVKEVPVELEQLIKNL